MSNPVPLIVDIRRNSLDDGPGIRSVVFFKGCPLRCVWCQNPEAMGKGVQLQRQLETCIDCGKCSEVCPQDIAGPKRGLWQAERCETCGTCTESCPVGARRLVGQQVSVERLFQRLLRDEPFYRHSTGGVTLSGGEPGLYPIFAGELAAALAGRKISVLLETCGYFDYESVARHLLPHVDQIYFDIKLADAAEHRRYTGADNRRIWDNLDRLLASSSPRPLPRVPLIPGITDTLDNLRGICELLKERGLLNVALLPYHSLGVNKRKGLGLDVPYDHEPWMSKEDLSRCRGIFEDEGFVIV